MPGSLEPLDINVHIPYHFRCPISLELMRDPVTVCTGQTYDRQSIESWVSTGNTTCPVTRVPLTDFTLIPNHTLRRLIQEWCVANHSFGVERIPTPKQPADPSLVRTLLHQASSPNSLYTLRVSALRRLRNIARDSDKNRSVIAANNAREVLIQLVFNNNNTPDQSPSEVNLESLAILSMFTLSEPECTYIYSDSTNISLLVNLLFHSSIEVRVNAASLIETVIAGSTRTPDLRAHISSTPQIFSGVIGILNYPLPYPKLLKIGIKALFALCLTKQNRHKAVSAGAVECLIDKLPEFEKCDAERALATVELLCRIPEGCAAFAAHALTVPMLVKIVLKVSDRATEYATGALVSICGAEERARYEAVAAGVLTQMLLVVQSGCTERGKRKAQMLLKVLRDLWPCGNGEDFGVNFDQDDFGASDVVFF